MLNGSYVRELYFTQGNIQLNLNFDNIIHLIKVYVLWLFSKMCKNSLPT